MFKPKSKGEKELTERVEVRKEGKVTRKKERKCVEAQRLDTACSVLGIRRTMSHEDAEEVGIKCLRTS